MIFKVNEYAENFLEVLIAINIKSKHNIMQYISERTCTNHVYRILGNIDPFPYIGTFTKYVGRCY